MLYASAGVGNQNHLAPEMFARAAGIKIVHIPHRGTAPAIVNKVSRDIARQLASAHVRSALAVTGRDLTPTSPEAFGALIRAEMGRWSKVIRALGLENSQ